MSFEINYEFEGKAIEMGSEEIHPIKEMSGEKHPPIFSVSSPDTSDNFPEQSDNCQPIKQTYSSIGVKRISLKWEDHLDNDLPTVEDAEEAGGLIATGCISDPSDDDIAPILNDLQEGIRLFFENLTVPDRDLLMTDFSHIEALNFVGKRSSIFESSNYVLHIYAPVAFVFFRELFGITTEDFQSSVCNTRLHSAQTNGRSGSKFYTTFDDRFILKTVQKQEANFLMKLFPGYYLNLAQHRKTLLPKYYGLYCYEKGIKSIRVLIMNNILPRIYNIHQKFDIKGSTYSKRRNLDQRPTDEGPTITLKDLDFIDNWPKGLYLMQPIYNLLLRSIEKDCKVLESYRIMDYSLLLGIVLPEEPEVSESATSFKCVKSSDCVKIDKNLIGPFKARCEKGKQVYLFVGIIDILQSYTWKRKIEFFMKSMVYNKNSISITRPDIYSKRFLKFLKDHVLKCIPILIPSSKKECCIGSLKY